MRKFLLQSFKRKCIMSLALFYEALGIGSSKPEAEKTLENSLMSAEGARL